MIFGPLAPPHAPGSYAPVRNEENEVLDEMILAEIYDCIYIGL